MRTGAYIDLLTTIQITMKKILIISLMVVSTLQCNAQELTSKFPKYIFNSV